MVVGVGDVDPGVRGVDADLARGLGRLADGEVEGRGDRLSVVPGEAGGTGAREGGDVGRDATRSKTRQDS